MRSHEERFAEAKRRIAARQRERRLRRSRIAGISAAAACLALIVGISGDYTGFETAGSVFHSSAALGYIVIGLLAFLLGVCVTILCFRLRQLEREDERDAESGERHGAD